MAQCPCGVSFLIKIFNNQIFIFMKKVLILSAFALIGLMSMSKPGATIFKVDAAKSTFKWTGKKVTGTHWGYIKFSDGSLSVEKGILQGGSFNVDMNSMDCQDTQGEYGQKLIGHLKSEDFFGTEKFPKASLVIKSATAKGNNQYDVKADLTIKGATNEVSFPAIVTIVGNTATAVASFNVDRTKFGIKYGSGSFFDNLGDKAIDNNFAVDVNLVALTDAPVAAKKVKAVKKTKVEKTTK
jgi:polyisoprenoid-binding protein YceI